MASPFCYCLLYTSDAADDLPCVDLGGRRIIKKNTRRHSISIIEDQTSLQQLIRHTIYQSLRQTDDPASHLTREQNRRE